MKKGLDWKIDASGLVQGPGFHDGTLYGVLLKEGFLSIYVSNYLGERLTIELQGLSDMNVSDFWNGSIIGEAFFYQKQKTPQKFWKRLFDGRFQAKDLLSRYPGRLVPLKANPFLP